MSPRQESNPHFRLRKPTFYPLNYEGSGHSVPHGVHYIQLQRTERRCAPVQLVTLSAFVTVLDMNVHEEQPSPEVETIDRDEEAEKSHEEGIRIKHEADRADEERTYYIGWARSLGKEEAWVDSTFEFNENGTVTCKGDLALPELESFEIAFPPDLVEVRGNLDLRNITALECVHLPRRVGGSLYLNSAVSLDKVVLPDHVEGDMYCNALRSAHDLVFPGHVGGELALPNLQSAEGSVLSHHVGGALVLSGLQSVKDLELPEHVGGALDMGALTTLDGQELHLPTHVGGDVYLQNLPEWERDSVCRVNPHIPPGRIL